MLQVARLRFPLLATAVACGLALGGCGVPRIPGITPYKMEIQQGNFVTQDQVARLTPGMTKEQVRFALGTPLLADVFHGERWDYVYWREDEAGKREQRRLSVFFEDNKLSRLDGDVVSAQREKQVSAPPAQETR